MSAVVYEVDHKDVEPLKKLLEYDPYLDKSLDENMLKNLSNDRLANIIFARQAYDLRIGGAFGIHNEKYYLYIKANDDFLKGADEKLKKNFGSIKRASKEDEERVIKAIEDEENRANAGIGSIFGG